MLSEGAQAPQPKHPDSAEHPPVQPEWVHVCPTLGIPRLRLRLRSEWQSLSSPWAEPKDPGME